MIARYCGSLLGAALLDLWSAQNKHNNHHFLKHAQQSLESFNGIGAINAHQRLYPHRFQIQSAVDALLEKTEKASGLWHVLCAVAILAEDCSGKHENDLGLAIIAISEQLEMKK